MKLIIAFIAMLVTSAVLPQDQKQGPGKKPSPEKRWDRDSEKIKKAVMLTDAELSKIKPAFMDFYLEMDALHEKSKGQRPAKEEVDKVIGKRNDIVKKVLTKDKYDKYMKMKKELRPPKPPKE
jgi:hypothetical protein